MLHEFRCTQTSARMVAKSEDADGADGQDDDADFHDDDDVEGDRGHHHEDFCFRSPRSSNLSPGHSTALAATGRGDSVSLPSGSFAGPRCWVKKAPSVSKWMYRFSSV